MTNEDILFGSRSGLHKAIRRGDLDLAATCFSALWANKVHRTWLKWRLPIIVFEEAWYMSTRCADVIKRGDEERVWRRFVYELTLVRKSKDAAALRYLATAATKLHHPEVLAMREVLDAGDANEAVSRVLDATPRELTAYETQCANLCLNRSRLGGKVHDLWLCPSVISLLNQRALTPELVDAELAHGVRMWHKRSGHSKPRTIPLPWHVFDKHTRLGQSALSVFMREHAKRYKIGSADDLWLAWFFLESARVPDDLLSVARLSQDFVYILTDNAWWSSYVKLRLKPVRAIVERWSEVRAELKKTIEWLVKERT